MTRFGGWNHDNNESNRARRARERGALSEHAVKTLLSKHGLKLTLSELRLFVSSDEWHHVGKGLKEVMFFERAEIAEQLDCATRKAVRGFLAFKRTDKDGYERFMSFAHREPRFATIARFV